MPTGVAIRKWQSHNGWLGFISAGEHPGRKDLPPADGDVSSPVMVDGDVPGLGRVRVTYETYQYKHRGRGGHWSWRATWADKIDDQGTVIEPDQSGQESSSV